MPIAFLQSNSSTADSTAYTFSDESLGAAAADRYIIACVHGRVGTSRTLSSVTIGGVTATLSKNISVNTESTNYSVVAIAIAAVPTGATGDVVVTFSGGMSRCGIALYRIVGLLSATPTDSEEDITVAQDTSLTIDAAVNGFIVATSASGSSGTSTWGGVDDNFDLAIESASTFSGGYKEYAAGATGQSV